MTTPQPIAPEIQPTELLVRTPAPKRDESLLGYVLRVSEDNGYDTPWHLLRLARLSRKDMQSAGFPTSKFASILGRPACELDRASYVETNSQGERTFKILDNSLGGSLNGLQLRLRKPALCPRCIEESGYIDAFWDLSFAVACPLHRCKAINICPACRNNINWFRPGILTCNCGESFSKRPLHPVATPVAELMALLKAKALGNVDIPLPNTAGFPLQALTLIPLRSLLAILLRLGKFHQVGNEQFDERDMFPIAEGAADVLADWPNGYYQFLNQLGLHFKRLNSSTFGFRKLFEPFCISLLEKSSFAHDAGFLRDEFVRFGMTVWGESTVNKRLLEGSGVQGECRFLTQTALARELGICRATLARWTETGLLKAKVIQAGAEKRLIMDAKELALSKQAPGRIFENRQAAKLLGFPVSVLDSLRMSGKFSVQHMPHHKKGIHEADLNHFRKVILDHSQLIEGLVTDGVPVVALSDILRNLRFWTKQGKAKFIEAYLAGTVKSLGRTGDSWDNVLFRKSDVDDFAKSHISSSSEGTISTHKAAKMVGCDRLVIPDLVARGYLAAQVLGNRTAITIKSLNAFSSKFLPLVHLARELNTQVSRLVSICRYAKIELLTFPHSGRNSLSPFITRTDQALLREQERLRPSRQKRQETKAKHTPVFKLRRYLEVLSENQIQLPLRTGRPDLASIARACGFDRSVLYRNKQAIELLSTYNQKAESRHIKTENHSNH